MPPTTETSDTLLELDNNQPQTVYVRFCGSISGEDRVGFSLQHGGVYHLRGLHWKNHYVPSRPAHADDRGYVSKFVTFVLEAPVYGIKCDLHYSPVVPGSDATGTHLLMCIPHGEFKAEYHFVVSVAVKTDKGDVQVRQADVDPKIVVSPTVQPTMLAP